MSQLKIDLPEDVFDRLMILAVREHRPTPQQAVWMLTRWLRDMEGGGSAADMKRFKLRVGLGAGGKPPGTRPVPTPA